MRQLFVHLAAYGPFVLSGVAYFRGGVEIRLRGSGLDLQLRGGGSASPDRPGKED
ncbi:MAG: hypothetical protein ACLPKI_22225 [Streptosporangiaceae bacterium]